MLKRIKRMWTLSKKDEKKVDELLDSDIEKLPDEGDGQAVFFGEGTQEEFEEQERQDKFGVKKLFGL